MWGLILPDATEHILLLVGNSQKEHTLTNVYRSRVRCAQGCAPSRRTLGQGQLARPQIPCLKLLAVEKPCLFALLKETQRKFTPQCLKGKQLLLDVIRPYTFCIT